MITIQEAARILEKKISSVKGDFTLNDAASLTGLPVDQAREVLDTLMGRYVCRLQVTENGDLLYGFGTPLKRRGEKTFQEKMDAFGEWLWKAFTVFFKAWITITLVVYFVLFVVILIAAIIAMSQGKDRKSNVNLGIVGDLFYAMFRWNTVNRTISYTNDMHGYRYRQYDAKKGSLNEKKKSFIASVYDFVFGPPRVEIDPLNNEKEVAAYVRKSKGIVTPTELVALAGWTMEDAERFLSDCVVRFKGEVRISDNGMVYGRFDELQRSAGDIEVGKIEWFWDEYEPEYKLTDNTSGRNALIVFLNGFNLFMATLLTAGFLNASGTVPSDRVVVIFLGWLPLVFSAIFFAVPIARWFKIQGLRRKRMQTNIRKRIMRVLFKRAEKSFSLDTLLSEVNNQGVEKKLTKADLEGELKNMMVDYRGEMILNDDGAVLYRFELFEEHEKEAARIRRQVSKGDTTLGEVIYDSASLK
ncbi:MAG: hypothetical protein KDC45_03895 [Bacteroidetes bacterium]|nr:hypothetical protein [Bacteroidota bacterium]